MKHKQNKYFYILVFLILYIVYYFFEESEKYTTSIKLRTLEKDGFCVLYNPLYIKTISEPCIKLRNDVLSCLPDGYVFMDYIYKINDGALSTFHRDVTSSKTVYKTNYPVYTLILYKYDGELLSLCPNSNTTHPFVGSRIVNVEGKSGTCFLFDCDLLHAGCTNYCKERHVIQYKLCHEQDLDKLSHLQGIRNEKNDVCSLTLYNSMMRKMSYYFQLPINSILYPLMIKRENKKTIIGKIQSFIPIKYYNNV
jgi:hypothetical protein